ncbi:hypothetical protein JCGZ_18556 [Jatropha curcas]|uniref:Uncharacterized protein n=1 Tax=Jatropha curcas TaxID=180498 RepID=A0A067K1I5_JATCU|nr:hypothetical protein JCGZ_18556 [Jatropha curcas]
MQRIRFITPHGMISYPILEDLPDHQPESLESFSPPLGWCEGVTIRFGHLYGALSKVLTWESFLRRHVKVL